MVDNLLKEMMAKAEKDFVYAKAKIDAINELVTLLNSSSHEEVVYEAPTDNEFADSEV